MARRIAGFATTGVLQLLALVLAHELVFLARYGSRYGEELVHSGHGAAWTTAVVTSLGLGAGLVLLGILRLAWLGVLVRRSGPPPPATNGLRRGGLQPGALLRAFVRIAPRAALVSAALLSIQENVEHAAIGQPMPGPGILLSPEYPLGLWITVSVALLVSIIAALFEWRRDVLLRRLRAARAARPHPREAALRRPGLLVLPPLESLLGRRSALRAPPAVSAA
jgi:hypothetical protein